MDENSILKEYEKPLGSIFGDEEILLYAPFDISRSNAYTNGLTALSRTKIALFSYYINISALCQVRKQLYLTHILLFFYYIIHKRSLKKDSFNDYSSILSFNTLMSPPLSTERSA